MTSAPLAARLSIPSGPLFFPVTAYGPDGGVDLDVYREHVRRGVEAGAAAVFACCGTGEFHALAPEEFEACVRAAVEAADGRVPVVAGAGYGPALAVRFARLAEAAGADGLLAMPPYLVVAGQEGLLRHYTGARRGDLADVVVYQRDNAVFTPETVVGLARTDGIIGFKDGLGDLDLMQRIVSAVRSEVPGEFLVLQRAAHGGTDRARLPGGGHHALLVRRLLLRARDRPRLPPGAELRGRRRIVNRLLDGFYRPFVELRAQGRGYAVSLVKAGYGCGASTWARCGRRCTSRPRTT